jgi:hypothetical protein
LKKNGDTYIHTYCCLSKLGLSKLGLLKLGLKAAEKLLKSCRKAAEKLQKSRSGKFEDSKNYASLYNQPLKYLTVYLPSCIICRLQNYQNRH